MKKESTLTLNQSLIELYKAFIKVKYAVKGELLRLLEYLPETLKAIAFFGGTIGFIVLIICVLLFGH